jgi:hypothetical protein
MKFTYDLPDLNKTIKHNWQTILIKLYNDEKICGIYGLFHKNKLVYVGQSRHVYKRIKQHQRTKKIPFTHYSIFKTSCKRAEMSIIESIYINYYSPLYNKEI